jgi:hypothetical protein
MGRVRGALKHCASKQSLTLCCKQLLLTDTLKLSWHSVGSAWPVRLGHSVIKADMQRKMTRAVGSTLLGIGISKMFWCGWLIPHGNSVFKRRKRLIRRGCRAAAIHTTPPGLASTTTPRETRRLDDDDDDGGCCTRARRDRLSRPCRWPGMRITKRLPRRASI